MSSQKRQQTWPSHCSCLLAAGSSRAIVTFAEASGGFGDRFCTSHQTSTAPRWGLSEWDALVKRWRDEPGDLTCACSTTAAHGERTSNGRMGTSTPVWTNF